ncbi:MAG: radical SAM/SPASM domain-containing protein, partial [Gemmatimonadetes bacterium]|nr:radical SAM/SPASM domain-containing protein [Gemmatimonadota bacterium]
MHSPEGRPRPWTLPTAHRRTATRPGTGTRLAAQLDFARAPFLVIWETTRACDLACKHCRAEAILSRDPLELTTAEEKSVMDQVRRFGPIVFVLSGGDPVRRPDLVELVEYGADAGLRMGLTPATTPRMTPGLLRSLKGAGLARLA